MTFSIFSPDAWFDRLAARLQRRRAATLLHLAAVSVLGALVPAVAVYIGTRYLTTAWDFELGYVPVGGDRMDPFRATLVGLLLAPWLLAAATTLMAPIFGRPRRPHASFAAAVAGLVPLYVACSFMFFLPAILLVALAFLLSCNWWGVGAQRLLGVDSSRSAEMTAISLLGASVALQFAGGWLARLV